MAQIDPTRKSLEISCAGCSATNRVPFRRLADKPICGRCKGELRLDQPVEVTDASFDALVGESTLPVLVDFWAPWCGPCRMVAPELQRVARERRGRLVVAKVNSDDNPRTAATYGIRSIPSLLVFSGGREQDRMVGAISADAILSRL